MDEDEELCEKDACRKIPGVSVRLSSDNCDPPDKSKCLPSAGFTDCQPLNKKKDCSK